MTARDMRTPLTIACCWRTHFSTAHVNRASTDEELSDMPAGSTPLHFAARHARYDMLDCITQLLAAGADPNIINSAGQTPLHVAALCSFVDAVNAL